VSEKRDSKTPDGVASEAGEEALVATAARPRLRVASSIATARAGEILAVDKRGRVLGTRQRRWANVTGWAVLGGSVALNGGLYAAMFSPTAGAVAALATAGFLYFRLRSWPAYRAAMALVAHSRWEEAHAELLRLNDKGLSRTTRRAARVTVGAIDQTLGRHQAALEWVDPVLADVGHTQTVVRWQAETVRALALSQLGRLAEARRSLASFPSDGPEYVELMRRGIALALAFEADAPESLPADEVLHEWARAALLRSKFGGSLISLSWAFHRRGDDDMARHLLAESTSRIPRPSLATAQPRLHAWAEERRAAWGCA
jgi:tetratricopeptide (TPR) repeat protein